jgi:hypothetical protein
VGPPQPSGAREAPAERRARRTKVRRGEPATRTRARSARRSAPLRWTHPQVSGGDIEEVTPDPIPNSEVKLLGADGTARATWWESRTPPGFFPEACAQPPCAQAFFFFSVRLVHRQALPPGAPGVVAGRAVRPRASAPERRPPAGVRSTSRGRMPARTGIRTSGEVRGPTCWPIFQLYTARSTQQRERAIGFQRKGAKTKRRKKTSKEFYSCSITTTDVERSADNDPGWFVRRDLRLFAPPRLCAFALKSEIQAAPTTDR